MDTDVLEEIVAVIRREERRRVKRLRREHYEVASGVWLYRDEPFLNELSLMMLVLLHHQIERELVKTVARVTADPTKELSVERYRRRVRDERKRVRQNGLKRGKVISRLKLASFPEWNSSMRTLQLLANCFKHSPSLTPDRELLRHLKCPLVPGRRPTVTYAPLPESGIFRERLALSLKLAKDADYWTIAEAFVAQARRFLDAVEKQHGLLSPVKRGGVSLSKFVGCSLRLVGCGERQARGGLHSSIRLCRSHNREAE